MGFSFVIGRLKTGDMPHLRLNSRRTVLPKRQHPMEEFSRCSLPLGGSIEIVQHSFVQLAYVC